MNIVKVTNKIALVMVVLLAYWVFIFTCSTVFGFKVFRENMSEIFLLSILGIFAVLLGSIIINIMFNLTAIAEGKKCTENMPANKYKYALLGFLGSLVAIFMFLYLGDVATSKKKEDYLVSSASALIEEQKDIMEKLASYSFSRKYIESAGHDIKVLSKVEEKFPQVTVIVRDSLNGKQLLLGFSSYSGLGPQEKALRVDYILSTSSEERQYLNSVFDGKVSNHRFSSSDGRYEIYYPVKTDQGIIVIHLSQYSRYGKMGS
ncbi:hypothetical protein H0A36_21860 [Endozoicomonas sp. SM1973]|uniref:Uncharacterized protein n=1 Tax=Spartinivicinus marinus TaxID=2994442 RepID=A0A853IGR8_9GAMM|nr:hypothetical protein [Spartinivicinus marinus]MCX4025851.1 hypothetical protein [Spartinivicinus marinus]NYZ68667.1 hypothetical protein [Spartinivicinus marinus]